VRRPLGCRSVFLLRNLANRRPHRAANSAAVHPDWGQSWGQIPACDAQANGAKIPPPGGDFARLSMVPGHTQITTTRRYLHLLTEDLSASHQKVSILNRLG
jgi:hypothetical protein